MGVLPGIEAGAQAGADDAGVQAVDAQPALVLGLLGQGLHQALDAEFGRRVSAPVRQAAPTDPVGGKDDGRVRGMAKQGQAGLGEEEGRGQVDAHHPLPLAGVIVIDAAEEGGEGGAVGDAIQPTEFPGQGGDDALIVGLVRTLQVQGQDGGFRGATGDNAVVEGAQLGLLQVGENDRRPVAGTGLANRGSQAIGGAGDEDDASGEEIGISLIMFHGNRTVDGLGGDGEGGGDESPGQDQGLVRDRGRVATGPTERRLSRQASQSLRQGVRLSRCSAT